MSIFLKDLIENPELLRSLLRPSVCFICKQEITMGDEQFEDVCQSPKGGKAHRGCALGLAGECMEEQNWNEAGFWFNLSQTPDSR